MDTPTATAAEETSTLAQAATTPPRKTAYLDRHVGTFLLVGIAGLSLALTVDAAQADAAPCHPVKTTVKHVQADAHQRQMIHRILTVGRRMHAKNHVMRSALAAATQESTLTNLPDGDLDSAGLFQIRAMHGSWYQRTNPEWASRWYFKRAINIHHWHPTWSIARIAQAVERSKYPSAYQQWVREATRTYAKWGQGCA